MRYRTLLLTLPFLLLLTACGEPLRTDPSPGALTPAPPAARFAISYEDPQRYDPGRDDPLVQACLGLPGVRDGVVQESFPPSYAAAVEGEREIEAFRACVAELDNLVLRELSPSPAPDPDTPVSAAAWTGGSICRTSALEPTSRPDCVRLSAEDAARLATLLDAATPEPADIARCQALGPVFEILLEAPSVKVVPVRLATPCGPITRGTDHLVVPGLSELVRELYDAPRSASMPPSPTSSPATAS